MAQNTHTTDQNGMSYAHSLLLVTNQVQFSILETRIRNYYIYVEAFLDEIRQHDSLFLLESLSIL
jgi:hypothetical protein